MRVCKSIIITFLNLFVNVIVISVVVFLMLLCVFWIVPNKAYVNYSTDDFDAKIKANSADFISNSYSTDLIFEEEILLDLKCDEILIDGSSIYNSINNSNNTAIKLVPSESIANITIMPISGDFIRIANLKSARNYSRFIFPSGENGLSITTDSNGYYEFDAQKFECLLKYSTVLMNFTNSRFAFVIGEDLHDISNQSEIIIKSFNSAGISVNKNSESFIDIRTSFADESFSLKISDISTSEINTSGHIDFYLTASPRKYDLINQVLKLGHDSNKQKNSLLNGKVEVNSEGAFLLTMSGDVNEAYISNFSLFPNFRSWYTDNITLIPLSLITAIFGGVALLNKKKEG